MQFWGFAWFYYNQGVKCWIHTLAVVWYIAVAVFIKKLCVEFSKKERKRYEAKELADKK